MLTAFVIETMRCAKPLQREALVVGREGQNRTCALLGAVGAKSYRLRQELAGAMVTGCATAAADWADAWILPCLWEALYREHSFRVSEV